MFETFWKMVKVDEKKTLFIESPQSSSMSIDISIDLHRSARENFSPREITLATSTRSLEQTGKKTITRSRVRISRTNPGAPPPLHLPLIAWYRSHCKGGGKAVPQLCTRLHTGCFPRPARPFYTPVVARGPVAPHSFPRYTRSKVKHHGAGDSHRSFG